MSTSAAQTVGHALIAGTKVPAMAIGTWSWGDAQWGWKPEQFEDVRQSWNACNKVGLTFYDTAEVYGRGESERIIGRLIKETDKDTRDKLYIATKFLPLPGAMHYWILNPPIVQALRKSLARLGVDSVDLYQIHSSVGVGSWEKLAKGMAECHKLGLCKAVGASNFSKEELIKFADLLESHGVPLASNQVEFSLVRQLPDRSGLLAEMKKRNIALLAYSPLAMGRLTGKYSKENPMPSNRRFGGKDLSWDELAPLLEQMGQLATKYSVSVSAIALNWVMCKGAIPLGGARNEKQATEMCNVFRSFCPVQLDY